MNLHSSHSPSCMGGAELYGGRRSTAFRAHLNLFVFKPLVVLASAGQEKRVGLRRYTLFDAGDYVGAAQPVGFIEISRRPTRGVVRMRVVKTHDVEAALPRLALNTHQFLGSDVIPVVGGIGAS